ncbi:MAG: AMP-binding protein, partial [Myxococcales bacterium]|nr:AMP-binding protein [Myxococcales bacterium]
MMRIVHDEPVTAAIDWTARDYEEVRRRHRWTVPERMNIADLVIDRRARTEPNRLALVSVDENGRARRFTYREIKELSDRIAGAYLSRGVGPGDRVGVFLSQGVENLVSHLAAHKIGAVSVPLSPLFRDEALGYRLTHGAAKLLVTDPEHLDLVAELHASDQLPTLEHVISTEDSGAAISWWNLARHAKPAGCADTSAEDPAMLIYTSGTEGLPKGALHCHRFLPGRLSGMELMHELERDPQGERPFWTPADWAWVAGLVDSVFVPLLFGCPVLAWRRRGFDAERIFRLIAREHVRSMFLPPTALNLLRHVEDARARFDLDVYSVHTAGEPCPPATYAWAHATFGRVYEFYGMTELALMIGNGPFFEVRPGSMGKPFPGYDVELLGADGHAVGTDEVGTIAVRRGHPGMFREYWEDPKGTAARFGGEWMITGDQATRDADGYLWYQGRADD